MAYKHLRSFIIKFGSPSYLLFYFNFPIAGQDLCSKWGIQMPDLLFKHRTYGPERHETEIMSGSGGEKSRSLRNCRPI